MNSGGDVTVGSRENYCSQVEFSLLAQYGLSLGIAPNIINVNKVDNIIFTVLDTVHCIRFRHQTCWTNYR